MKTKNEEPRTKNEEPETKNHKLPPLHVVASLALSVCLSPPSFAQEAGKKPADWGAAVQTLTSLTLEQAREWAGLKNQPRESGIDGSWATLDKLSTLTPEIAEVLVQPDVPLSLNGLSELSPETAARLAQHKPVAQFGYADLRLNGLKTISAKAAEALAAHPGRVLLYSLERLDSIPLAQKLARGWGELRLGLTELSPGIAAELSKHRGNEEDRTRPGVVARRADGSASILRLDNICALAPETAEALAAHEGVLVLNALTTLPPAVAASLAKRTGNSKTGRSGALVLNGLETLSTESAAALAAFTGELVLKALPELTPETAAALSKHRGRLHLTGLRRLTPECHETLKTHPNLLLPRPLPLTTAQ